MKNWNRFFAAILTTALVAGCGKDNPGNNNVDPEDSKKAAYMSISVALPSAKSTRSETENGGGSTGGTEIGQDKENNVKKILLLLANEDNTFGTSCTVENLSVDPGKSTVKPTAKIMRTELRKFYDSDGNLNDKAKNGIRVYVFCNPTDELITAIEGTDYGDSDWTDKICQVLQSQTSTGSKNIAIWADNSFLMSNAASALRQIPSNFETWRVNHDTEYNAFDLSGLNNGEIDNLSNGRGSIKVERSVARFDFKDGSSTNNNTYDIGLGEQKGQLQVKLYRMALVNMSQNFYYLRRVSDDGKGRNKKLCGSETPNNYVDDTDADFKTAANLPPATLKGHFNYPLFDNNGQITEDTRKQWDNYWIDDVLASQEDHKDYTKAGYHIWRYVTENTIPQDDDKQRNGITTGVVFKGKLIAGNGLETANQDLYNAIQGTYNLPEGTQGYTYDIDGKTYPVLYVFQNMIYTGWNAGVAPAAERPHDPPPGAVVQDHAAPVVLVPARRGAGDVRQIRVVHDAEHAFSPPVHRVDHVGEFGVAERIHAVRHVALLRVIAVMITQHRVVPRFLAGIVEVAEQPVGQALGTERRTFFGGVVIIQIRLEGLVFVHIAELPVRQV